MVSESKKERWKARREEQRQQLAQLEGKRKAKRTLLWALAAVAVLALAFVIYRKVTGPGEYDAFAECLAENGMTMYGTDWCPHCQRQKQMFGKSFTYVHYVNCDLSAECDEMGVQGYPTWAKDGKLLSSGVKQMKELATASGCALP